MASDDEGGGRGGLGSKRHARDDAESDDDLGGVGGLGFGGVLGGGRKKRRGQNDENLFGIFARDDHAGGKKGRGKAEKNNFSTPVSFVKSTTMLQPTSIPTKGTDDKKDDDADNKSDADDEIDQRFVLDANAPNAQGLPAKEAGPQLPARNKLSFNQMSSSYGKGFAMMQKMGFSGGGIGRHNDGIANPITVQPRAGKMGLQDEGEKVGQDLYGTEHIPGARHTIEELLSVGMKKKKDEGPKMSESWKRDSKEKKPKVTYKTAAELSSEGAGMRIVDMRGPEVRVATSFTELQSLAGDGVRSLKELRHNTRLLVSRYEDKIRSAGERKRHFENILLSAAKEQERLQAASDMSDSDVKSCKELVLEIDALRDRQDRGLISLGELADAFRLLRGTRPKEFQVLKAMDVAFSLALPTAKRELSTWRPLQRPEEGLLSMKPWRDLAESVPGSKHSDAREQLSILLEAALLPRLRHAMSAWAPRDAEPCLRLMEQCRAILPTATAETITAEVVLPRLRAEIEAWDPRVDQVSAHLWLHPWLPFLGKRMDVLWPPVRFKISACLDRWDPTDRSAHGFLKPWVKVFDSSNWDPLIEKVLLRLERSLADTPVQPDGQDMQPMKDFIFWLDLAPLDGLARVLESAFFPQWHSVLQKWLRSPSCNFSEVLQWYQGWKAFFPSELKEQATVQKQLAHGLEVMKHIMANGKSTELPEGPQAVPDSTDNMRRPPPASVKAPVEEISLSLTDYITEVAAEEGLLFLPKKMQRNGKQIYQLGAATIQIDKNLVFAAPKGGEGDWKAVSMDEVLALAQASTAKKKSR